MSKQIIILLLLLLCLTEQGQAQGWYRNYEKYWWYRYRLVNDFMKIGEECGESIPAKTRQFGDNGNPGLLHWGDAMNDLGHYMVASSTERQILAQNAWSTRRTEMEAYYAIKAFDRIDKNAEDYCKDIDLTYPCKPSGNFVGSASDNGFFIRDDVPGTFVQDRQQHFNRQGVSYLPVVDIESDYWQRTNPGIVATWSSVHPGVPRYPHEESQDQVSEAFVGLAMCMKYLPGVSYNGQNLQTFAAHKIDRLTNWVGTTTPAPWYIKNPLTHHLVYGTNPDKYFDINLQWDAGGNMTMSAPAVAGAFDKTAASCCGYNANSLYATSSFFNGFFEASQWVNGNVQRDISFTDLYVAFARNWHAFWLPFPWNTINTSWTHIRDHAMSNHFQTPHTPLIYKLNYPNNGIDYCPECHGLSSYDKLLDSAPFCGPHNYHCDFGGQDAWEWSGQDRLSEFFDRDKLSDDGHNSDENNGCGYNADFNGLDYMELFNLYAMVKGDYLEWIINPYYTENFNTPYPDWQGFGSKIKWLQLNYLEYLSCINKISADAHITFRGAKKINLLPGFYAVQGSYVKVYIQDYACTQEDYHYATVTENQISHSIEYNPTGEEYSNSGGSQYHDKNPEDENYVEEDNAADQFGSPDDSTKAMDSLRVLINATDDQDYAAYAQQYFHLDEKSKFTRSNGQANHTDNKIHIYPNPNNGAFVVDMGRICDAQIKVLNVLGEVVTTLNIQQEQQKMAQLEADIPPGNYTIIVTNEHDVFVKKITIVR